MILHHITNLSRSIYDIDALTIGQTQHYLLYSHTSMIMHLVSPHCRLSYFHALTIRTIKIT